MAVGAVGAVGTIAWGSLNHTISYDRHRVVVGTIIMIAAM